MPQLQVLPRERSFMEQLLPTILAVSQMKAAGSKGEQQQLANLIKAQSNIINQMGNAFPGSPEYKNLQTAASQIQGLINMKLGLKKEAKDEDKEALIAELGLSPDATDADIEKAAKRQTARIEHDARDKHWGPELPYELMDKIGGWTPYGQIQHIREKFGEIRGAGPDSNVAMIEAMIAKHEAETGEALSPEDRILLQEEIGKQIEPLGFGGIGTERAGAGLRDMAGIAKMAIPHYAEKGTSMLANVLQPVNEFIEQPFTHERTGNFMQDTMGYTGNMLQQTLMSPKNYFMPNMPLANMGQLMQGIKPLQGENILEKILLMYEKLKSGGKNLQTKHRELLTK